MAILQGAIATAILGFFYYRIIKRETPTPISWLQALLPIGLGAASLYLSFYTFIGVSFLINKLGISAAGAHDFIRSLLYAFMTAGFPEELTKLAFMIIALIIFRKNIKNVYEYILIGAAIGIGFTLPEEFLYGDEGSIAWFRFLTIAGHMIYGIIMARHIGIAKYNKINGKPRFLHYVLALAIPVLIHTLYDACTGNNLMLLSEDSAAQDAGIIMGLVATGAHFVLQFVILYLEKKNCEKHCNMVFQQAEQTKD